MNTLVRLYVSVGFIFITAYSCEKIPKGLYADEYISGKIIQITCGGTVVQLVDTNKIVGETWDNFFVTPIVSYSNCVLVGNLSSSNFNSGDTIYFNCKIVDFFSIGGPWCDIGGLPSIKIEITDLFNSQYFINEN